MAATTPALDLNFTLPQVVPQLKKNFLKPAVPADIVNHEETVDDESSYSSSLYMMIFIPLASVIIIAALAATARWRYHLRNQTVPKKDNCKSNNNNNIADIEQGKVIDEVVPAKTRNSSTSSSSAVSHDLLVEGALPVTVSMRIVPDVKFEKETSRSDFYCEIKQKEKQPEAIKEIPQGSRTESEVLKKESPSSVHKPKETEAKTVKFSEAPVETHPKRPQTLQVMTVVAGNNTSDKGFPWSEQLWTPDAEIIYEETDSPATEYPLDLNKERRDCLFPLMAKGRFKMKPKGLLERRGSNVALTISLKNEEKSCASPPPSSRSPKPLVYLRTATAKLDPLQLHIRSADTARLQQEFWEVPMNHPSEKHFSIPGYGTKNRYRSILPNPHSRVLLPATPSGDPLSAYINANYIRGYSGICETERRRLSEDGKENDARRMSMKRKARYIATQGPMANTIVDFWKMLWKENSNAIVMITKLKERKEKCAEYIPSAMGEKRTHENFEVEITNVRYADHYTVRTIELRNSEEEGVVRYISHFWYSEWLDHETPEKLRGLITLVQEVETTCQDSEPNEYGPIITHCSAGIGRTGCFIAISIGCAQLRAEAKVDVLKIICQLRMDRGGMIQTWEQYQYVHAALSRYARMLAGENVATPSTASSIRSPSSRHSTPVSAGIASGDSTRSKPTSAARLFSPKPFAKPELSTVNEASTPPRNTPDNVLKDAENNPPREQSRNDVDRSIFSPFPTKPFSSSRFSFSCAVSSNTNSAHDVINGVSHQEPNGVETSPEDRNCVTGYPSGDECNGEAQKNSKRTKKSLPPHLVLKLSSAPTLARDENWLMNGHCAVEENSVVGESFETRNGDCENMTNGHDTESRGAERGVGVKKSPPKELSGEPTVAADAEMTSGRMNGGEDAGCRTPVEGEAKSSIFTFPSPEK